LGYLVAIVIVVGGGASALAVLFVRHESRLVHRPSSRPSRSVARRGARPAQRVVPGDLCVCGGTIGQSGQTSDKFGDLLGCTGCDRSWTMDGRKIIRRSRRPG
jgi:hypothetical protein